METFPVFGSIKVHIIKTQKRFNKNKTKQKEKKNKTKNNNKKNLPLFEAP